MIFHDQICYYIIMSTILLQLKCQQYYHPDYINQYQQEYPRAQEYPDYDNLRQSDKTHYEDDAYIDESDECRCLCNSCENLQPCCKNECANCLPSQPNAMFIPYIYPIIITKEEKNDVTDNQVKSTTTTVKEVATTTTEKVTTTLATTQTENNHQNMQSVTQPIEVQESYQFSNNEDKFVLTSLRRTKTKGLPKYGIVPLPEQLAEKILLQLRNVKLLHPKNNMRTMDFLNKYSS